MTAACAPLVDEDEIVARAEDREDLRQVRGGFARRVSGAAGEKEHRICGIRSAGREPEHEQIEGSTRWSTAILRHRERAALGACRSLSCPAGSEGRGDRTREKKTE
jgi:hypothetical protein